MTGAAVGIGEGIAGRLIADGWCVGLIDVDDRVMETATRLTRLAEAPVERALPIIADVAAADEIESAINLAVDRWSGLDVAVANAGVGAIGVDLVDMSPDDFDRVIAVNLRGVYLTCRAAGRVMRAAGAGCIVTISSIFGWEPKPGAAAYSASKAAVIALTQALSAELAPSGVRVNGIAPGNVATPSLLDGVRRLAERHRISFEEEYERVLREVPLGRMGAPAEIGAAVAFLASEEAAYITGHTLGITGGLVRR